jgi:uncharacterized membrane protein (DUF4010 family)
MNMLPKLLIDFFITFSFSLLIGIEQRRHFTAKGTNNFGTDRTFTFIGILGFILALLPSPFYMISGLIAITFFLGIFYFSKLKAGQGYGFTSEVLALLIFCMPVIVMQQPRWLAIIVYVLLLLLAEMKGYFETFSKKLDKDDFFTLSKFIIMLGVILPVLPKQNISTWLPVSPYKIWLAIVVISGISYTSYLLKKYIFPKAGLLLTGILGGLYSSTATTFIIARKSNDQLASPNQYAGAILSATAMMYLRLFVLIIIFNLSLAMLVLPYFLSLFIISLFTAWWIYKKKNETAVTGEHIISIHSNPLEFKIAIVFAVLYLVFTALTQLTLQYFGATGLTILSFLVGFTDIDPFLLNLFQGTHNVSMALIAIATLQAMFSNNVLKMIYGILLSKNKVRKNVIIGFTVIIVASIAAIAAMYIIVKP